MESVPSENGHDHQGRGDILVMAKVAERCNLDCDYCYMYHGVDQSWKDRPKFLNDEHLELMVERLVDHKRSNPEARMTLELHGGEPLLMGLARMRNLLSRLRRDLSPEDLLIVTQTNAVLLSEDWLYLFSEFFATFSVSCDGPRRVHDSHRLTSSGGGSFAAVEKAIRLALQHPLGASTFNGVLAVADPNFSGRDLVRYFYELGVRRIDILLPDANYAYPPTYLKNFSMSRLLCYLVDAFDEWVSIDDSRFRVRMFESFIKAQFGKRPELDAFGGDISPIVVVESDGSYRLLDALAICEVDVCETGMHLDSDEFSNFMKMAKSTYPTASSHCLQCEAFATCGGGYLPHRYDGTNYDNPSFYCEALFGLHKHVRKWCDDMQTKLRSVDISAANYQPSMLS